MAPPVLYLQPAAVGVRAFGQPGAVIFDVKGLLPAGVADARL